MMRKRIGLLPLLLLFLIGCSAESSEVIEMPTTSTESDISDTYDPLKVKVGEQIGSMTIKSVEVKPYMDNQPLVDIVFDSEPVEISGNYFHDPDRLGITFVPDPDSQQLFPKHNLFEYDARLYFVDEKDSSQFGNADTGKATIEVEGYHEIVNYKDEAKQNSTLIRVIELN